MDVFDDLGITSADKPAEVKKEEVKKVESWIPNKDPEYVDLDAKKPEWDMDDYRRACRMFLGKDYKCKVHIGNEDEGYIFTISPANVREDIMLRGEFEGARNLSDTKYAVALLDVVVREIKIFKDREKTTFNGKFFDLIENEINPVKVYAELVYPLVNRYMDLVNSITSKDEILKK